MNMLEKLRKLKQDKSEPMSDNEKSAKMNVVGSIKQAAEKMMGEPLKGLKKVSVMAPDKEGMKEGLDVAKEIVGENEDEASEAEDMLPGKHDPQEEAQEESSELGETQMPDEMNSAGLPEDKHELHSKLLELEKQMEEIKQHLLKK